MKRWDVLLSLGADWSEARRIKARMKRRSEQEEQRGSMCLSFLFPFEWQHCRIVPNWPNKSIATRYKAFSSKAVCSVAGSRDLRRSFFKWFSPAPWIQSKIRTRKGTCRVGGGGWQEKKDLRPAIGICRHQRAVASIFPFLFCCCLPAVCSSL